MGKRSRRRYGPGMPSDGRVMPHKIDENDQRLQEMAAAIDLRRPPIKFGVPPDLPAAQVELAEELYRDPSSAQGLDNPVQRMTAAPLNGEDC